MTDEPNMFDGFLPPSIPINSGNDITATALPQQNISNLNLQEETPMQEIKKIKKQNKIFIEKIEKLKSVNKDNQNELIFMSMQIYILEQKLRKFENKFAQMNTYFMMSMLNPQNEHNDADFYGRKIPPKRTSKNNHQYLL